ncbi:hypothetical protein Pcinc_004670 [Petrolisthes cinctipes]|uniref:Uncharacterized protein n=1 Tax=Petrolisthes cinctipes TaxID=88211 RepID=A0AAE1GGR5_PETCI|nr:hypothetical protein Pcinc_004670 [Petrolisthes cinctipes]
MKTWLEPRGDGWQRGDRWVTEGAGLVRLVCVFVHMIRRKEKTLRKWVPILRRLLGRGDGKLNAMKEPTQNLTP